VVEHLGNVSAKNKIKIRFNYTKTEWLIQKKNTTQNFTKMLVMDALKAQIFLEGYFLFTSSS
jgi:hypothetical protein